LEGTAAGSEGGGIFVNGNVAVIWSPGDVDLLRVFDEDNFGAGPRFKINGFGGIVNNITSGNMILGQVNGVSLWRVDSTGQGFFANGTMMGGVDFAESFQVEGERDQYEPGDVMAIDPTGTRRMNLAREPYSSRVAGIYSTKPGILATPYEMDDPRIAAEIPLAIVGVVPCKVTAENGPIAPGDLLVTSSTPGHAMKGTDRFRMTGSVVGKALGSLSSGTGIIEVLVSLQ
jgi:hypothetical protein